MITNTQRPNATIRTSGGTIFGGAPSFHAALSDDNDVTLVRTAEGSLNGVKFASLVLPAGAIVRDVVLRMRLRRAAGGINDTFASLNGGPADQLTPGNGVFLTVSTAPKGGFTPAQVAAGIDLFWNAHGPEDGSGILDAAEAWLDVTHVPVPTVTITSPGPSTPVTQPPVEWQTTSDFAQSRYQVKIYSQAQYEAPGFTPDLSTPEFDSGAQIGAAGSLVPRSVNLTNGATYRFYVRVAQQVGAQTQYSLWTYVTTTVNATPPPVPTVTPTPDDALARIKLRVVDSSIVVPPGLGFGLGPFGLGPFGGSGGFFVVGGLLISTWQFVTIERTADGGTTWEPVRGATHARVAGESFTAYDYESCNGEDVQYRARAIATAGGSDVASGWSVLSAPVHWSSPYTWFKAPTHPEFNSTVRIEGIPSEKHRNPQGTFDVPGRVDPIVVSAGRKLSEGTVTFVTLTPGELSALQALLDLSEVLLLQTPPEDQWGCRYIAVGDHEENRVSRRSTPTPRQVVCPFVEVLAPIGDIVGFGITWDDVAALYATWDDLAAANPTWNALAGL